MFIEPRPFAREFLRAVGELFTVYIYTAGKKSYADAVLDIIDVEGVVQRRFYRDSCRKVEGKVVKDLRFLKKASRVKEQMFLVDDNVDSINNNYPFALRIAPFEGSQQDIELLAIFQKVLKLYV
jgi:RNA polymerase II subunit A small phosphatase-like protein